MTRNSPHITRTPEFTVRGQSGAQSAYARVVKPVIDRVLGLLLLLLALPVMVIVAAVVLWTLGWPVLFWQERVGFHGQRLGVVKFRTMRRDRRRTAQALVGPERRTLHKSDADPRHTAVGRALRRFSLDELPQLALVVAGRMSLVGPRPEVHSIVSSQYTHAELRRLDVRPGLTGLWQIHARGAGRPMHEGIDFDLRYVEELSARVDAKILVATIPAALGAQRGR